MKEFYTCQCEPSHGPIEIEGKPYWTAVVVATEAGEWAFPFTPQGLAIVKKGGKLASLLSPVDGGPQIIKFC